MNILKSWVGNKNTSIICLYMWMDVQYSAGHSTLLGAGGATRPLQLGQKEENIPDGLKGKHCASCHSGVGWDWRGVQRKGSLEIENERDVI